MSTWLDGPSKYLRRCREGCCICGCVGSWKEDKISLDHLREVNFNGFSGQECHDMAHLLLLNSPALQKMTVVVEASGEISCEIVQMMKAHHAREKSWRRRCQHFHTLEGSGGHAPRLMRRRQSTSGRQGHEHSFKAKLNISTSYDLFSVFFIGLGALVFLDSENIEHQTI